MSFLGVSNTIKTGLVNALGFQLFSEEEYKVSFEKMDKDGSGCLSPDEVEEFLYETYGFPPLEEEVNLFMDEFDLNQDGRVTWDEFVSSMTRLKEQMNEKAKKGREYTSYS